MNFLFPATIPVAIPAAISAAILAAIPVAITYFASVTKTIPASPTTVSVTKTILTSTTSVTKTSLVYSPILPVSQRRAWGLSSSPSQKNALPRRPIIFILGSAA